MMNIFIIYDSNGRVWEYSYESFQSAVDVVSLYVEEENRMASTGDIYDDDNLCPAKMEKTFNYKDDQYGILVAYNEFTKLSIFVKEIKFKDSP